MKVTFISCFLSHHQIPFSDNMYDLIGENYKFISVKPMDQERVNMGWEIEKNYKYEIKAYESQKNMKKAIQLINDSDVVILGSAEDYLIEERMKNKKLTFKYSERLYKKGLSILNFPRAIFSAWLHHGRFQKYNLYMLCASAYTATDLAIFKNYENKMFKWGYFPETKEYNIGELLKTKQRPIIEILWAGRIINWKHLDHAIKALIVLDKEGYTFNMTIIGDGEERENVENLISKNNLKNKIKLVGVKTPEEVRKYMERTKIYLFTSDFQEGWGAVLNEAMNSACAVVASHSIGAVPFLIKNNKNGLVYEYGNIDDLCCQIRKLIENNKLVDEIGKNAYYTCLNVWNSRVAAERFIRLSEQLMENKKIEFESGPCSMAIPIKQELMYKKIITE